MFEVPRNPNKPFSSTSHVISAVGIRGAGVSWKGKGGGGGGGDGSDGGGDGSGGDG